MPENEYLPFKAINVFIERDYLETVIKDVLEGIGSLSREEQTEFNIFYRKHVSILGFRNPVRAPLTLKINGYAGVFEEKEDVIPFTLTTWTKIKSELSEQVKNWLDSQGWEALALEREFDENIGFTADWPENLTFDEIEEKFKTDNPKVEFNRDDLILMVLWISGKLPNEQSDL